MPTTQQLREERANVWEQMKGVMDVAEREGRELSAEERSSYDAAEKDLDRLGEDIERQERHEARQRSLEKVDRSGVVAGQERGEEGRQDDGEQYKRAFAQYVRGVPISEMDSADARALRAGAQEARALGVATPTGGGYLAPPEFDANLREAIRTFGGLIPAVTTINTDTGAELSWPTVDDTANVGAILAENTQVTEQDVNFGTASLRSYKYTSKMVRVSMELLQDAAFDVEAYLRRALAQRIARIWNQHFTTGTGTNQPLGLVTNATVGKVGAGGQVTTITYDDLIDLIDSIDPAYQTNAQWMMASGTRKAVRKLKDTQGRPLWEPSIQAGQPDQLLGFGYIINSDMPAPGANAKSVLFGDYREAYVVREVLGTSVMRLNERYADYGQAGFLGFARADGTVQNGAAYRAYAHPAA